MCVTCEQLGCFQENGNKKDIYIQFPKELKFLGHKKCKERIKNLTFTGYRDGNMNREKRRVT